jgi:hypothetical protein
MSWGVSLRLGAVASGALLAYLLVVPPAQARPRPDFNGDGLSDLAIAAPFDEVRGVARGAVTILYGARHRVTTDGSQFLSPARTGMAGSPSSGFQFGRALGSGDLNGDGRDDLVVQSPWAYINGHEFEGAVQIIYGGRRHLSLRDDQQLNADSPGIRGDGANYGDTFGDALGIGDFDGDGHEDMAIGEPGENLSGDGSSEDGLVHVLYGGSRHLHVSDDHFLTARRVGIRHGTDNEFGDALGAGDFNGDGFDDLAVGAPGQGVDPPVPSDGAVAVLFGGRQGLDPKRKQNQFLTEETPGIAGNGASGVNRFGSVFTDGDFNRDGRDDLVIGVPGEWITVNGDTRFDAGAIHVLYGGRYHLSLSGDQFVTEETPGLAGHGAQDYDRFGVGLATGDFNGDRREDLAVGAGGEDVAARHDGAFHVLYGGPRHLRLRSDQLLTQDTPGMEGDGPRDADYFGGPLTTGRFDADRRDDLAVGEPQPSDQAGAIHILYGARNPFAMDRDQFMTPDNPGMPGNGADADEGFGLLISNMP